MRLSQLPIIFLLLFIISGCAHKKLMNAGNDYLSQGKYQSAVEKYQKALREQPSDAKTLAKLKQAQALFNGWLEQVEFSAQQAEKNHQLAKAQLLYAKLAKHRSEHFYHEKVMKLQQENLTEFGLNVYLDIKQPALNQSYSNEFEHVKFQNKPADSLAYKNNEIAVMFSFDGFSVDTNKRQELASKQYVSGYETIINPAYQDIQNNIVDLRIDIKGQNNKLAEQESLANVQDRDLLLMEKNLQIAQLLLEKTDNKSTRFYQLTNEINDLYILITKQKKNLGKTDKKIAKTIRKIKKYNHQLDDLFHQLEGTPELADVEVYSDYQYTVNITEQVALGELFMKVELTKGENRERHYEVTYTHEDKSHRRHKRIALKNDPLRLKSNNELKQLVFKQARNKVTQVIEDEVGLYQQSLLTQANRLGNLSEQLNIRLMASLVSQQPLPVSTYNSINQQLIIEFGSGGTFKVAELLNR
jgi:hypothetical protein